MQIAIKKAEDCSAALNEILYGFVSLLHSIGHYKY